MSLRAGDWGWLAIAVGVVLGDHFLVALCHFGLAGLAHGGTLFVVEFAVAVLVKLLEKFRGLGPLGLVPCRLCEVQWFAGSLRGWLAGWLAGWLVCWLDLARLRLVKLS